MNKLLSILLISMLTFALSAPASLLAQEKELLEDFLPGSTVVFLKIDAFERVVNFLDTLHERKLSEETLEYKFVTAHFPRALETLAAGNDGKSYRKSDIPESLCLAFFELDGHLEWLLVIPSNKNTDDQIRFVARLLSPGTEANGERLFIGRPAICLSEIMNLRETDMSTFLEEEIEGRSVHTSNDCPWAYLKTDSCCVLSSEHGIRALAKSTDTTIVQSRRFIHSNAIRDKSCGENFVKDVEFYVDILPIFDLLSSSSDREDLEAFGLDCIRGISGAIDFGTSNRSPRIASGMLLSQPESGLLRVVDYFHSGPAYPEVYLAKGPDLYASFYFDVGRLLDSGGKLTEDTEIPWLENGIRQFAAPFGDLGSSGFTKRLGKRVSFAFYDKAISDNGSSAPWAFFINLKNDDAGHELIRAVATPDERKSQIFTVHESFKGVDLYSSTSPGSRDVAFVMDSRLCYASSDSIAKMIIENQDERDVVRINPESNASCFARVRLSSLSLLDKRLSAIELFSTDEESHDQELKLELQMLENGISLSVNFGRGDSDGTQR